MSAFTLRDDPDFAALTREDPKAAKRLLREAVEKDKATSAPPSYWQDVKQAGTNVAMMIPNALEAGVVGAKAAYDDPRAALAALPTIGKDLALGAIPGIQTAKTMLKPNTAPGSPPDSYTLGLPDPHTALREGLEYVSSLGLSRVVPKIAKAGIRRIPGVAHELHAQAIPHAQGIADALQPSREAVQAAYTAAKAAGAGLPNWYMTKFRQTAQRMLDQEVAKANPDGEVVGLLRNYLRDSEKGWDFEKTELEAQDLGQSLRGTNTTGGARPGEAAQGNARLDDDRRRELLAALYDDVGKGAPAVVTKPAVPEDWVYVRGQWQHIPAEPAEYGPGTATAATRGVAGDLEKKARNLARRRFAAGGLRRLIDDSVSTVSEGVESLNLNRVIGAIRKAKRKEGYDPQARLFAESFTPKELRAATRELSRLKRKLPPIAPAPGVVTGTSTVAKRALVGGTAGELAGGHVGGEIGLLVATVGPAVAHEIMSSAAGRAAVRFAMKLDPTGGATFQQAIAGLLRGVQMEQRQPTPLTLPAPPVATPAPAPTMPPFAP